MIFKDFETSNWTWHSGTKAYYWHRFYHHQPDLNYDSPYVRQEMLQSRFSGSTWAWMGFAVTRCPTSLSAGIDRRAELGSPAYAVR